MEPVTPHFAEEDPEAQVKSLAGFTHKVSHCAAVGFVGPVVVWDLLLGGAASLFLAV